MSEKTTGFSRRRFIGGTLTGAALAGLPEWFVKDEVIAQNEQQLAQPRHIGPNDTIQIAGIGLGGSHGGFRQGLSDTRAVAGKKGVKCVAVCDLDSDHLDEAAKIFGPDTKKYHDFREVLARPDIDAVVIGTPDHWHSFIAIAAMKAGKPVYCEKPLTLTIDEGKKLVQVWKQTNTIFQTGSQQRSDARFRMACELVRNGRLGKLKTVEAHLPTGPQGGPFPVLPVPARLDWTMWQGQVTPTDFVTNRSHGNFRYWIEYSGGMMTDWGAHHNDIAQWGMGTDRSGPTMIEAAGVLPKPYAPNCYNTFTNFDVTYTYPNGVQLLTSNKGENGVQFNGENGWIFVSRGRIGASDPKLLTDPLPDNAVRLYVSNDHHGNFVDGIRTGKMPICDAEIGHRSVSVCHLGNISLRLGGKQLQWDPVKEEFVGDPEASLMLQRVQREPWVVTA